MSICHAYRSWLKKTRLFTEYALYYLFFEHDQVKILPLYRNSHVNNKLSTCRHRSNQPQAHKVHTTNTRKGQLGSVARYKKWCFQAELANYNDFQPSSAYAAGGSLIY